MLLNHLKIARRNLLRNKLTAGINMLGLGIGIAACLVIWQYVQFERSYDAFFPTAERVYRVNLAWGNADLQERYATAPPPLAEVILKDIPEAEAVTRAYTWSDFTMRPDHDYTKIFRETNVYAVSEDFFKVFPYRLIEGDAATALQQPQSVVMPRSTAVRYFGEAAVANGNIVGRRIMGGKDAGTPWTITGVMPDLPENTHFQFTFLISSNSYPDDLHRNPSWTWPIMHTYVLFREKPTPEKLYNIQEKFNKIAKDYGIPQIKGEIQYFHFPLQALTDIHLTSHYLSEMAPNGNLTYVNTLTIIALFILILAGVNYINLATAHATARAKEVGVKKVMGAGKRQLVAQFLTESLLLASLATLFGFAIMKTFYFLTAQFLIDFPGQNLWSAAQIALITSGIALSVGLLAGIYPSLYIARFQPLTPIKNNLGIGVPKGNLRNALVVFQFVISIGLIATTMIVNLQVGYFQHKNLGFNKENIFIIQNDREIEEQREAFKQALKANPQVLQASFSSGIPGLQTYQVRDFRLENTMKGQGVNWYQIDEDYLPTMDMQLLAGRNFSSKIASDTFGVILNEAAIAALGIHGDPLGQTVIKNQGAEDEQKLQIIGVVKDFNFESLHHEIKPLAMQFLEGFIFKDYVSIRLAPGNLQQSVAFIEKTWSGFEPQVPITYSFLDENLDQLFKSELQLSKVLNIFTGLALFIACLGLYGLVLFVIERRRKEISIRKIIGASAADIILLLNKNFLRLTFFAFIIATPIAWYAVSRWLENFAYRIDIQWWMFAIAGIIALGIALLTVSFQAIRVAIANPVNALKNE
ncbi:MAG: ABC transporter permease [Saprospiraceae bacterium]